MSKVILDIETSGVLWDALDEAQQKEILKYAEDEDEIERAKSGLTLSPLTGEVVAIGLLNPETSRGAVYFQAPNGLREPIEKFMEGNGCRLELTQGTEQMILERFWADIMNFDQLISFAGRTFDGPFLHIRSALHDIKATKNLVPYRYGTAHFDILDQLTFFGAGRRSHFTLDMVCRAFGIESPKSHGITGDDVPRFFREGKYLEIARYCAGDLIATKKLLERWDAHIGKNT